MPALLLITDDAERSGPLVRALRGRVDPDLDLHTLDPHTLAPRTLAGPPGEPRSAAPGDAPGRPRLIVGDVHALTAEAVFRLRPLLRGLVRAGVPFVALLHDAERRTRLQAHALGACRTLDARRPAPALAEAVRALIAPADPSTDPLPVQARRYADAARAFLDAVLFGQAGLTPERVDAGTDLVARAVAEIGIRDWVRAVQRFDDVTHQHILLVAGLGAALAGDLGFNPADHHRLTGAALLHDVGKTRVPVAILNKPGPLDARERRVMRAHAVEGHALLAAGGFEAPMLAVARSHHEALDGSGYPDGLRGPAIPDLVRLVTVCDVYAALIERRPYKAPMPGAQALAVLRGMAGRLDVDLLRAFSGVARAAVRSAA